MYRLLLAHSSQSQCSPDLRQKKNLILFVVILVIFVVLSLVIVKLTAEHMPEMCRFSP